MDFRGHIRTMIAKTDRSIEFGASYAPILAKRDGYDVVVIDHADQETLQAKYAPHGVDISRIEPVDAIDDGGELTLLQENGEGFDYIVASHVFEHLTDPILFLQRCERALKPDGKLILLVPDRRFCFDYFRPVSTCGQMLRAFLEGSKRHNPAVLYDHSAYNSTRNGAIAWAETTTGNFVIGGSSQAGYAAAVQTTDDYVDCHAWVFTPSTFRLIIQDLREIGLIAIGEAFFHGSVGCEFLVILSASAADNPVDRITLAQTALAEAAQPSLNGNP